MRERPKFFIEVERTKKAVIEIHASEEKVALSVAKMMAKVDPENVEWNTLEIKAKILNNGKNDV